MVDWTYDPSTDYVYLTDGQQILIVTNKDKKQSKITIPTTGAAEKLILQPDTHQLWVLIKRKFWGDPSNYVAVYTDKGKLLGKSLDYYGIVEPPLQVITGPEVSLLAHKWAKPANPN